MVPHAPLLLPDVSGARIASLTEPVREAMRSIDLTGVDLVVVLSPHGPASGVYGRLRGSLDGFGIAGFSWEGRTDADLVTALARRWSKSVLREGIDHGVLVPLALVRVPDVPVVAATLAETTPASTGLAVSCRADVRAVVQDARDFATAARDVFDTRATAFLASVNTSAAPTPRPPPGEADGDDAEKEMLAVLKRDVGELEELAVDAWRRGSSCSAGPIAAVGRLFCGGRAEVLAYARPFGVGYPVASLVAS